jgi:hypothetical protein
MKNYRLINNTIGWFIFTIAATTYLMTIEPSVSLWDCGEFIATAFKFEVGHPPGNPVFMVMARFFSLFAMGDVTKVAAMVNAMSALASAFTILFLFWTITHLSKKILLNDPDHYTTGRIIAVMATGAVGALAYTFSDSFWFSAVEGEVYASSSFFTAIVVWAILKWEDVAEEEHGDRWIILIAFLMGLSIGVHLLNLLAIPAILFVYYFKKFPFTIKGFIICLVSSIILLTLLMYGIMPGVVTVTSKFELFFVNVLGLPYNTGMIFHLLITAIMLVMAIRTSVNSSDLRLNFIYSFSAVVLLGTFILTGSGIINVLILLGLAGGIWVIAKENRALLNLALTAIAVIMIGYSSYAIIVIRATDNPPINENNPYTPFGLLYYLNREQYGERPLFRGPYYNAPPVTDYKEGKPHYSAVNGKYVITNRDIVRIYDNRFVTIFPRMWSSQSDHQQVYQDWVNVQGTPIQVTDESGNKKIIRKPTFGENLKFLFSYQLGYMYFRYFMWNFSGRQNDTQGYGGAVNGNWITGIKFLDEPRVGTIDMPDDMKSDPSRNTYYLLPLILGLAGMFYHLNKDNKNWWIVLLLFFMTGMAIVLYLNQYPNQPRERDYAYAGSFYFFSIWVGMGVLAVFEGLSKIIDEKKSAIIAGVLCLVAVPAIMASENYKDHDRSGRYLTRDVAFNYLNSCAPGAILFTNGDNDTFPLWYAQEVEGVRTDVRVCNLMLLNTDWYIEQMKQKAYESEPLPISLPIKKYYDGVNNQVYVVEKIKDTVDISKIISFIMNDSKASKIQVSPTEELDYIPTRTIRIPVDAAKVLASGTVKPEDADKIVPYIDIRLNGSAILKSQLLVLDILANNNWERPIYFVTGYQDDSFGLEEYFQLEGLAYRLVPIKSYNKSWLDYGRIDTDILYENMINKFKWEGAKEEDVNLDYNIRRTITVIKARYNFARLSKELSLEGDKEKALMVLDHCMEELPLNKLSYDMFIPDIIEAYFMAGGKEKAAGLSRGLSDFYFGRLDYYLKQNLNIVSSADYEIQTAIQYTSKVSDACVRYGETQLGDEISKRLEDYYNEYIKLQEGITVR